MPSRRSKLKWRKRVRANDQHRAGAQTSDGERNSRASLRPVHQFDPELVTEVEIRFIAESATSTRVELEHRNLQRMGERAAQVRGMVDAARGWTAILECFKQCAAA
jgi:hypothetical protein